MHKEEDAAEVGVEVEVGAGATALDRKAAPKYVGRMLFAYKLVKEIEICLIKFIWEGLWPLSVYTLLLVINYGHFISIRN